MKRTTGILTEQERFTIYDSTVGPMTSPQVWIDQKKGEDQIIPPVTILDWDSVDGENGFLGWMANECVFFSQGLTVTQARRISAQPIDPCVQEDWQEIHDLHNEDKEALGRPCQLVQTHLDVTRLIPDDHVIRKSGGYDLVLGLGVFHEAEFPACNLRVRELASLSKKYSLFSFLRKTEENLQRFSSSNLFTDLQVLQVIDSAFVGVKLPPRYHLDTLSDPNFCFVTLTLNPA